MKIAFFLVCAGLAPGCGGSVAASADASPPDASPPDASPPDASNDVTHPPAFSGTTFAIQTIHLGDADRSGQPSNTAWQSYGRNVDGLVTTNTSTDVCTLAAGAGKLVQGDGDNGIDNAWGGFVLPILETALALTTPSSTMSHAIQLGTTTLLIQTSGLDNDPSQTASSISGAVLTAASYPNGVPAFDSTTDWPVASTTLADGQTLAGGAIAHFSAGTVTSGHFDSGTIAGPITLNVIVDKTITLPLMIHDAVVSFDHTTASDASNGMLSGVLDTQEFVAASKQMMTTLTTSLCGSGFDPVAQALTQSQEILSDGSNHAGVACNAISIGIGFEAKLVANPTKVGLVVPPLDPCP